MTDPEISMESEISTQGPFRKVSFAQIEPTTRCNFTCGFCCGRHMPQEDLSFEAFLQTLDSLPGLRHIELQGEGEPLMNPRFFEMVAEARRRGIEVYFITNGSFFSEENVERILTTGVRFIQVSIESADARTFGDIRGGKLTKVTEGIARLLATRTRFGLTHPAVGFAAMVMRRTQEELGAIIELYRSLGMDGGISVQLLQGASQYTQFYSEDLKQQVFGREEAERLYLELSTSQPMVEIRNQQRAPSFYRQLMAGWDPASGTCPWLERGVFVMRDGTSSPCCYMKDAARHGYGRLNPQELEEANARRESLRRAFLEGQAPDACATCPIVRKIEAATGRPLSSERRHLVVL